MEEKEMEEKLDKLKKNQETIKNFLVYISTVVSMTLIYTIINYFMLS